MIEMLAPDQKRPRGRSEYDCKQQPILISVVWAMTAFMLGVALQLSHSKQCKEAQAVHTLAAQHLGDNSVIASESPASEFPFPVTCTTSVFSKQSCLFKNVCLQLHTTNSSSDKLKLTATSQGSKLLSHRALLEQHLQQQFLERDAQQETNVEMIIVNSSTDGTELFGTRPGPTVLWRPFDLYQYSFGHTIISEAYPLFMVLQNFYGPSIPSDLQLLITAAPWADVLRNMYTSMMTKHYSELLELLQPDRPGVCFAELLVGDGGYPEASRKSFLHSPREDMTLVSHYIALGTWYNSNNWWHFRRHVLQIHGLPDISLSSENERPLVLMNDKRFGPDGEPDRRTIINLDDVRSQLAEKYPHAEVKAVRFRDVSVAEQIALLSRTTLFITSQASSSFVLVFLPRGATCLMVGNPVNITDASYEGRTQYTPFHELDAWFPLTYVRFIRYEIELQNINDYRVRHIDGLWQPDDPQERINWWLYNADVRLDMGKLIPMIDPVLQSAD